MLSFAAALAEPSGWSINTAIVMISCNVVAVLLWKSVLSLINSWLGNLDYESRAAYGPGGGYTFNFGVLELTLPELVGATSFGHVIGAATILGLTQFGVL